MNPNFDILIIGSGAGGGTVAQELSPLCAKGARIGLLEWGGKFEPKDNTRDELGMAEKYYFDGGGFLTQQKDMTLAFAKSVGGSTSVYTGTSLKAPADVFERWNVPGITREDLDPRYDQFIKENNVHLNSADEINDNNRLFYEACQRLKWHAEQFPVNTRHCQGLATCNLGCAAGAKQGTAQVQIPKAIENGVELFPLTRVNKITEHEVYITGPEGEQTLTAKKIVVCAGAIHSPTLLMKSFGSKISPALGRYFTCHPALILVGQHAHPIQNTQGHPKSYFCDEFTANQNFLLETCIYYPFTLAKNLTGFGSEMDELMGHFSSLQMILALAIDPAEKHNRVYLNRQGKPVVDYYFHEKTLNAFVAAMKASTRIFFAAGAERVHAPAMEDFFIARSQEDHMDQLIHRDFLKLGKISISAAHLMGGCRMGVDPNESVCDSWGKVHGFQDLYVADASLFPAASEVNPYLTIMALAHRVAEGIRKGNDL